MARVTLKQVAAATGLTVAAVSLALRGRAGVSAATRERVEAAARRLGYRRDPALQVLTDLRWGRDAAHRAPNLAVYTPDTAPNWPSYMQRIYGSMVEEAFALGWGVETVSEKQHPDPVRLQRLLQARGVAGVIVCFHAVRTDWYPQLDFSKFAVVGMNSMPSGLGMHQVRLNFYQFIEEAWERLLAAGYRRIGFCHLANEPQAEVDRRRLAFHGWVQAWQTPVEERVPAFNLRQASAASFSEWLNRWDPDVVLSASPALHLLDSGLLGGLPFYSLAAEGNTPGMARQPERTGITAVRLLDSLYRRGERGLSASPEVTLISGQWRAPEEVTQPPTGGTI